MWLCVCLAVFKSLFLSPSFDYRSAFMHVIFRLKSVSCVSPAVFLPVSVGSRFCLSMTHVG